jgi:hypothetical protein
MYIPKLILARILFIKYFVILLTFYSYSCIKDAASLPIPLPHVGFID